MVTRFDWQKDAACAQKGSNPEWWFAPRESPEATAAQAICTHDCPVYEQCAQYTRDVDLRTPGGITGIWAGRTYREQWRSAGKRGRSI